MTDVGLSLLVTLGRLDASVLTGGDGGDVGLRTRVLNDELLLADLFSLVSLVTANLTSLLLGSLWYRLVLLLLK